MSEPRHCLIYRDCDHKKWWLNIVVDIDDDTSGYCRNSNNAEFFGPFNTAQEAEDFASDNMQNVGYEIPVMNPTLFDFMSTPKSSMTPEEFRNYYD